MARSKAFSSVALDIWNMLPCHLSSVSALPAFRKRLKHHLFSSAFPCIPKPYTDIMLCDVITSTNVNHIRCTLLNSKHVPAEHLRLVLIPTRTLDYILAHVQMLCLLTKFNRATPPMRIHIYLHDVFSWIKADQDVNHIKTAISCTFLKNTTSQSTDSLKKFTMHWNDVN